MSNTAFGNRLLILDTKAVITAAPCWIRKVFLFPNAAADLLTLSSWNENATPISHHQDKTCTVTSASIITSTGNDFLSTDVTALDVIYIYKSSTGNNLGRHLVLSRGGDTFITTIGSTLTNDVAAVYSWKIWTPTPEVYLKAESTIAVTLPVEINFDYGVSKGLFMPNIVMPVLSTSAVATIYIG